MAIVQYSVKLRLIVSYEVEFPNGDVERMDSASSWNGMLELRGKSGVLVVDGGGFSNIFAELAGAKYEAQVIKSAPALVEKFTVK